LEENVQYLIAHGDLDAKVLAQQIIRSNLDAADREVLARELLAEMDDETAQRLLAERPRRRTKKRASS
jgi:hypothetical protein